MCIDKDLRWTFTTVSDKPVNFNFMTQNSISYDLNNVLLNTIAGSKFTEPWNHFHNGKRKYDSSKF